MENNNSDKLAKSMLFNSRLELDNPDFKRALMGKIKAEDRKRTMIRQGRLYLALFLLIDASILELLKLLGISIAELSRSIGAATHGIAGASSQNGNWLLICFLIQTVMVIFMIGALRSRSDSRG